MEFMARAIGLCALVRSGIVVRVPVLAAENMQRGIESLSPLCRTEGCGRKHAQARCSKRAVEGKRRLKLALILWGHWRVAPAP